MVRGAAGVAGAAPPGVCVRLFIGLWPDEAVRVALQRHLAGWTLPAATVPTRPERLHLTLHFLGAVARDRVALLGDALNVGFEPFELDLTLAQVWPNDVAVLQPASTPAALGRLHRRLGEALRAIGQPTARGRLRPHVTLARSAAGALPPAQGIPVRWAVRGYALVESEPAGQHRPATYRVVQAFP